MSTLRFGSLPVVLLALLLPVLGAAAPAAEPADLAADSRLARSLAVDFADEPLTGALRELSARLAVPLTASRSTGDDRVSLQIRSRPAREVLALITEHFGFRWAARAGGYTLEQDPLSARAEARERQREADAEWRELRGHVDQLNQVLRLPAAERGARLAAAEERRKTGAAPEERAAAAAEAAVLEDARRPGAAAAVALLPRLTALQMQHLRSDEPLLLRRTDLPPETLSALDALPEKLDDGTSSPFTGAQVIPVYGDALLQLSEYGDGEPPPSPYARRSVLRVELIQRRGAGEREQWRSVEWRPRLPDREPEPAAAAPDEESLRKPVRLQLPARWTSAPRVSLQDEALTWDRRSFPHWIPLGEVARALHASSGVDLIADSFARSRVDPAWIADERPLSELLDRLARELRCRWAYRDGVVRLRSATHAWDRELEPPASVLGPWQARAARSGAASLDQLAELASALTDRQALGLGLYWGWRLDDPAVNPPPGGSTLLHALRRHLRFWHALRPAQRQQVLNGELLPVAEMDGPQQQAFAAALLDPPRSLWGPAAKLASDGRIDPAALRTGAFSLKQEAWKRQVFIGTSEERTVRILAIYPSYRPPNVGNLPEELQWSTVGAPCSATSYQFSYHLSGEKEPARTVQVDVLRR
ncbi:MAG: hypothetical protein ACK47B_12905 [Armatimonadota bacterium]